MKKFSLLKTQFLYVKYLYESLISIVGQLRFHSLRDIESSMKVTSIYSSFMLQVYTLELSADGIVYCRKLRLG